MAVGRLWFVVFAFLLGTFSLGMSFYFALAYTWRYQSDAEREVFAERGLEVALPLAIFGVLLEALAISSYLYRSARKIRGGKRARKQ